MLYILIVDDQTYLCELFQYESTGENCHITGVSNTESVNRYLEDLMPDIVLLEISLHGFEGRGCCTISMERTPVFQS